MPDAVARKDARQDSASEVSWLKMTQAMRWLAEGRYTVTARVLRGEIATTKVAGLVYLSEADVERIAEEKNAASEGSGETAQNGHSARTAPEVGER